MPKRGLKCIYIIEIELNVQLLITFSNAKIGISIQNKETFPHPMHNRNVHDEFSNDRQLQTHEVVVAQFGYCSCNIRFKNKPLCSVCHCKMLQI